MPLNVLVYSDNARTREQVMLALGKRVHPKLPDLTYTEVATAPVVVKTVDAGGVDLAILDGEATPAGGLGIAARPVRPTRDEDLVGADGAGARQHHARAADDRDDAAYQTIYARAPGAVAALRALRGKYPLAIVSDTVFTPGTGLRELLRGLRREIGVEIGQPLFQGGRIYYSEKQARAQRDQWRPGVVAKNITMLPLGTPAPDFRLPDTDGRLVGRDDWRDAPALLDIIGANNGYVITIEDNYGGGIGSAVADALVPAGHATALPGTAPLTPMAAKL